MVWRWKWLLLFVGIVMLFGVWIGWEWWQMPQIGRTTIAKVPPPLYLLLTDLDDDGVTELLALWDGLKHPFYRVATPIWHPLTNPQILRPIIICDLTGLQTERSLQSIPTSGLTWLRWRNGRPVEEPFPPQVRGKFESSKVVDVDGDGFDDLLVTMQKGRVIDRWLFSLDDKGEWRFQGKFPDGRPVKPSWAWEGGSIYDIYFGDLDGDGMIDEVWWRNFAFQARFGKNPKRTVHSRAPEVKRFWLDDLDGDGRSEIIAVERVGKNGHIAILEFDTVGRCLRRAATSPPFSFKATKGNFAEMVWCWTHDLDGDGRKDILCHWQDLATHIFWWEGERLQMRETKLNLTFTHGQKSRFFTLKGNCYLVLSKKKWGYRFRPRLLSLRPLKIEWQERIQYVRSELWRLPIGKDALNPNLWTKAEDLPGEPMLIGDLDNDGRVEMVLRNVVLYNRVLRRLSILDFPSILLPPSYCLIHFAQFDGRKVHWVTWQKSEEIYHRVAKLRFVRFSVPRHILTLSDGNKTAFFIGWDNGVVERVRWK